MICLMIFHQQSDDIFNDIFERISLLRRQQNNDSYHYIEEPLQKIKNSSTSKAWNDFTTKDLFVCLLHQ